MHETLKGLTVIIIREDLEVHYCQPGSLELVKMIKFKNIDEFEKYLLNCS